MTNATRTSWPAVGQVWPARAVSRNVPTTKRPSCWTSSSRAPHGSSSLNLRTCARVCSSRVIDCATIAGTAK